MCFCYYSMVSQTCRASRKESTFGQQPEHWLPAHRTSAPTTAWGGGLCCEAQPSKGRQQSLGQKHVERLFFLVHLSPWHISENNLRVPPHSIPPHCFTSQVSHLSARSCFGSESFGAASCTYFVLLPLQRVESLMRTITISPFSFLSPGTPRLHCIAALTVQLWGMKTNSAPAPRCQYSNLMVPHISNDIPTKLVQSQNIALLISNVQMHFITR